MCPEQRLLSLVSLLFVVIVFVAIKLADYAWHKNHCIWY